MKRLWIRIRVHIKFPWRAVPSPARRAHDPVVALALWALALAGGVAIYGSARWWHFELVKMLPVLGSVVVLLGSYFAARTLRDNEIAKATEMLGSKALAVRIAGIHQLGSIGMGVPRFRKYAQLTLYAFLEETRDSKDGKARDFAEDVLEQLGLLEDKGPKIAALSVEVGELFPQANPASGSDGSGAAPGS